jgi:hypothetical protein
MKKESQFNGNFLLLEIDKIIKKSNFIEIRFKNDKKKLYICKLHAFISEDGRAIGVNELKSGEKIWIDVSAYTSDKSFINHTKNSNKHEMSPRKSLAERYSIEASAKKCGLTVEDFKIKIKKEIEMKQQMIDERLAKGYTQEQALNETLRCLYISGFSGPTFKD